MSARAAIGLDLGGTNLKGAVVDHHARIICKHATPTDAARGPDAVIADMVALIERLIRESRLDRSAIVGIGVGSPGPLSMKHGIIYHCANLPGWNHVPLTQRLQDRLRLPVILENDGNAAAFGEFWSRSAAHPQDPQPPCSVHSLPVAQAIEHSETPAIARERSEPGAQATGLTSTATPRRPTTGPPIGAARRLTHGADLVALTIGTGVGAGVILEGRVLHGHFENAAELGHTIVVVDGLPCPCGQHGCLEQYASAGAIARRVVAAIRGGAPSELREIVQRGGEVDATLIAEQVRKGDDLCRRIWDEACLYLAVACINIQHSFNPERIVLAGGLTAAGNLLLDGVHRHVESRRWILCRDHPAIEISRLGADVGVIGAAGLVWATL